MKETTEQRSRIMRAVKSFDTAPEMLVRRLAHGMGYRFGFIAAISRVGPSLLSRSGFSRNFRASHGERLAERLTTPGT